MEIQLAEEKLRCLENLYDLHTAFPMTGSSQHKQTMAHYTALQAWIANNWRHVRIAAIGESPLCVAGYASRDASTIDTTRSETRKY